MTVVSDTECACKYYTVKNNIIYDLNGAVQTQKWAKRMRQKEQKESNGTSSASSGTGGAVKGTMAIAVPGSNPQKEAVGR